MVTPQVPQNLVENAGMGLQQQQISENAWLFQALAKHQKAVLEQLVVMETQANAKLWEQMMTSFEARSTNPPVATDPVPNPAGSAVQPVV